MGALPKNKITSVERGKRRRGNAPKLKRDLNSAIPNHKQGFVAELLRFVGVDTSVAPKVSRSQATKPASASAQAGTQAMQAATKVGRSTRTSVTKVRKTMAQSGK